MLDRTKRRASDLDNNRAHNVVGTKQQHLTVHLMQAHNKTITCTINYYKTLRYTKSQLIVYRLTFKNISSQFNVNIITIKLNKLHLSTVPPPLLTMLSYFIGSNFWEYSCMEIFDDVFSKKFFS